MSERVEDLLPLTHVVYHVLLSLSVEPRHGYGIIKDVSERTGGRLELEAGTLYAAVRRLRAGGLIEQAPAPAATDSRRRYYDLTPAGRSLLLAESQRLAELVDLARDADVLPETPGGA